MVGSGPVTKNRNPRVNIFVALFFVVAAFIFWASPQSTNLESRFELTSRRAGVTIEAPTVIVPTSTALNALALLIAIIAVWQLFRRNQNMTSSILMVTGIALFAFLVWATRDKSLNFTGMLVSSLIRATPIALAALSGIYSERSGVVNIGIEGMMLVGAFTSTIFASVTDSMLVGVIAGVLGGLLLAAIHAVLSIRYRVNQIVSGAGLIILALGITSYLQRAVLNVNTELNSPGPAIAAWPVPGLSSVPVIGPLLFNQSPIGYALFILIGITYVLMNFTAWGLRIRSVGEHPKAADTLGINVYKVRYVSVLLSGAIAGLAGSYMSIGAAGRFNEGMTAGKGFLGLAAMIFGNWNPGGAFVGSLIFGFFDSWQEKLSILQVGIPVDLLGMAPYLATMIVLSGAVGRSKMPAADGQPYEKE